jgi:hypothetical protein
VVKRSLLLLAANAKSLLAVGLIAAGTALIYVPAAFIVAGVLLLADRITD